MLTEGTEVATVVCGTDVPHQDAELEASAEVEASGIEVGILFGVVRVAGVVKVKVEVEVEETGVARAVGVNVKELVGASKMTS